VKDDSVRDLCLGQTSTKGYPVEKFAYNNAEQTAVSMGSAAALEQIWKAPHDGWAASKGAF
jgi:hypothetical protein